MAFATSNNQITTIQITDTCEYITPGIYTVECPSSYDPTEIVATDIVHDGAIRTFRDADLYYLYGTDAINYGLRTGRSVNLDSPGMRTARSLIVARVGMSAEEADDLHWPARDLVWSAVPLTETFRVHEDDAGHVWLVAVEEGVAIDMGTGPDRLQGCAGADVELYRREWAPEDIPDSIFPSNKADSYRLIGTARFDGYEWAWEIENAPCSPAARAYLAGVV